MSTRIVDFFIEATIKFDHKVVWKNNEFWRSTKKSILELLYFKGLLKKSRFDYPLPDQCGTASFSGFFLCCFYTFTFLPSVDTNIMLFFSYSTMQINRNAEDVHRNLLCSPSVHFLRNDTAANSLRYITCKLAAF